ncbi:MAG: hypothetical protein RIT81_09875 [Deltaproteobacteria bacterium]
MPNEWVASFQVPKKCDAEVISCLRKVAEQYPDAKASATAQLGNAPQMSISLEGDSQSDGVEKLLALRATAVGSFTAHINPHGRVQLTRSGSPGANDSVKITVAVSNPPSSETLANLAGRTQLAFGTIRFGNEVSSALAGNVEAFYTGRETALSRIEALSEDLLQKSHQRELQAQNARKELEARLQEETNRLQEKLRADFEAKTAKVQERANELDSRARVLDTQESRNARRVIRRDIKEELKSRSSKFSLSDGTSNMRRIVHVTSWMLLIAFGASAALGWYSVGAENQILAATRGLLPSFAFGATAVFYLRWTNQWFHDHASEEFRLKRLELDVDRASWLVEMAFEWRQENSGDLPDKLLETISKGLFMEAEFSQAEHPFEQLIQQATSLNVKMPNGSEASLKTSGKSK